MMRRALHLLMFIPVMAVLVFPSIGSSQSRVELGPEFRITQNPEWSSLPAIAIDSADQVHLSWAEDMIINGWFRKTVYKKLDLANPLSLPISISEGIGQFSADSVMAVGPGDRVHIEWHNWRFATEEMMHVSVSSSGQLGPPFLMTNTGGVNTDVPRIAVDANHGIHILYSSEHGRGRGIFNLFYQKFTYNPTTDQMIKEALVPITSDGGGIQIGDLALDSLGDIHIVWSDDGGVINYTKLNGISGAILVPLVQVSATSSGWPEVAVDKSEHVHIVWYQSGDIFYKKLGINGETLIPNKLVTLTVPLSNQPGIAIDSKGNPQIVWVEEDILGKNFEMFYTALNGQNGTKLIPDMMVTSDDQFNSLWGWPAIAIDSKDIVHVTWIEDKHRDLANISDQNREIYYRQIIPMSSFSNVRIIDTFSNTNIDLVQDSFARPPFSMTTTLDQTAVEWRFDTFSIEQIEDLSFDVTIRNPFPGESRLVNHKLELFYDDINGNPVQTVLGPQSVDVLSSVFTPTLSTNKALFTANEDVLIALSISNLGNLSRTIDTVVEIEDSLGNPVHTVATLPAEAFLAGVTKSFPGLIFNTGSTFAGDYRVHVRLIEAGIDVGEVFANFTIAPVKQAASTIVTDKISYSSNETVTLSPLVISQSPNATLTNLNATVTVSDSLDVLLFTESRALADLLPGAGFSYNAFFNTSTLPAGLYTTTLQVNTNGIPLTTSTADFEIISSLEQANALSGTLTVNPGSIFETESTILTYTIQNTGNEFDLPLISIEILVVDPNSQNPIRTLTDQTGLNGREVFIRSILFNSEDLNPRDYLLILRGTTAGITQTLDSAGLQVKRIPNTAPTANAGVDQNALTSQVILLDGSLSSDDEGDPLTFKWDFASKPAASTLTQASITNNGSSTPTFIPDVEGVYIMSLVVNDGLLDSAIDTVSVFVNPAPDIDIHPEVINLKSNGASKSITGVLSSPALSAFEFFTAADGLTVTATFRIENTYIDKNGTSVVYTVPADVYPGDDTVVPTDSDLDGIIDLYQLTLKFNRDLLIAGVNDVNQQLLITQPTDLTSTVIATVGGVDIVVGSDTNIMIHPPTVTLGGPP